MDGQRFDRWTRAIAAASCRRGLLKGVAAAIAAGLFAAEVEKAEAARSCQVCRRGQCTPRPDGTRCSGCGICLGGACVPDAENPCGPCKHCDAASLRCVSKPNGDSCGDCGSCTNGSCRPNRDQCAECGTCRRSGFGYSCSSGCPEGKRCCPDGRCIGADECCDACPQCTTCEDGACQPDRSQNRDDCGGSNCKACDNGQCLPKPHGTFCPPDGVCCDGACRAHAVCCTDDDCPECSTCKDGTCDPAPRNGETCGNTPTCHVCDNGQCVQRQDGFNCIGSEGTCCGGFCCIGNQECCGGQCCDGICVLGFCCPTGFAAAEAELCCPFGPPCGEGNGAHCCGENQHCCESSSTCCDNGAACCAGGCCPAGLNCCDGQCQEDECDCPFGERRCPGGGSCCPTSSLCAVEGCCSIVTALPCCVDNDATTGRCTGPCCSLETEQCCINEEATDNWCCPASVSCFKDSCCPVDKPIFTAAGGGGIPQGIYCCPEDAIGLPAEQFLAACTQSPVEGRRG